MLKGMAWAAGILLVAALVLVVVALQPAPPVPPSGCCPTCGPALIPVHYGQLALKVSVEGQVRVDGHTFDLARDTCGSALLLGGCVVPAARTGFVCLLCRSTWPMDRPPEQPPLRRLWGGLLRRL